MEPFNQLTHFINGIAMDSRLKPVHISLSMALYHTWIANRFQYPCRISRRILMKTSHIRSKATYHKVLKELQLFGYIRYKPSYHPLKASEVILIDGLSKISHG